VAGLAMRFKTVSLVAAGTGITPMYQIITAILRTKEDPTKVALLYANHSIDDVLLNKELEQLAKEHLDRFKYWQVLSHPPPTDWTYSKGHINEIMLHNYLFPASDEAFAIVCGPPALMEHTAMPALRDLGYTRSNLLNM